MFENCDSLIFLPDISEWILNNSLSRKYIFEGVNQRVIKKIINKMNNKPYLNVITIIYDIKNKNYINIFGENFVKNNRNNCFLEIDGKKMKLYDNLKINKNMKNTLEIKLIETKTITNMKDMFNCCNSLKSVPDILYWDTSNVINMRYIFVGCQSLKSLPDISIFDTSKVSDMSFMFKDCVSLISLPDISKWDTSNVTNMNEMFSNCRSLISLPDISK